MFQRAAPLDDLAAHTPLAIVDVARFGADLRVVARVTRESR
jgi:hypothetical protein